MTPTEQSSDAGPKSNESTGEEPKAQLQSTLVSSSTGECGQQTSRESSAAFSQAGAYSTQVQGNYIKGENITIAEAGFKGNSYSPPPTPSFQLLSTKDILEATHNSSDADSVIVPCVGQLLQKRFVVLTASHEAIALSTARKLAPRINSRSSVYVSHFALKMLSSDKDRHPLTLGSFVDQLDIIMSGSIAYLNISALPNYDAQSICAELRRFNTGASCLHITSELAKHDYYCFFFVGHGGVPEDPENQYGDSIAYSLKEEEELVVASAAIREETVDLIVKQKLKTQLNTQISGRTVWGNTHIERISNLLSIMQSGDLRSLLNKYEPDIENLARAEQQYEDRLLAHCGLSALSAQRGDAAHPDQADPVLQHLCRNALFAATAFGEITVAEFDWLMSAFLEDETIEVKTKERRSPPPSSSAPPSFDNGGHRIDLPKEEWIENSTIINLLDAYRLRGDALFALLDIGQLDNGHLAFMPANKRDVASACVFRRMPLFFNRLIADQSIAKSLLFRAPETLSEKVAALYASYIAKQPQGSRSNVLIGWMARLVSANLDAVTGMSSSTNAGAWVVGLIQSALRPVFARRFALLFERLLNDHETRGLVDDALDYFMTEGRVESGRFELILDFVRALGPSPHFDALYWYKRLLAEGDGQSKARALRILSGLLEIRSGWLVDAGSDTLADIRKWLPCDVSRVDGINSQSAVLLVPRLSFHIASDRVKSRDIGRLERLIPFFDLRTEDGLSPFAVAAIEILTSPVEGTWILFEMGTLEKMVELKWCIETEEDHPREPSKPLAPGERALQSLFPNLVAIEEKLSTSDWNDGLARRLTVSLVLIEASALLIGRSNDQTANRHSAVSTLISEVLNSFQRQGTEKEAYALYQQVYRVHAALRKRGPPVDPLRLLTAQHIGNLLYLGYKSRWPRA